MLYENNNIKIDKIKYNNNKSLLNKVLPKIIDITSRPNTNKNFILGGSCSYFNEDLDQSGKKLFLWKEFRDYIDFIKPHIQNYLNEINKSEDYYYVTGMWANVYPPGTHVAKHKHNYFQESSDLNDILAILLYLRKPNDSGNLIIDIPENNSTVDYKVTMEEGDVVMFQSSLCHQTEINKSCESKFIIGIELVSRFQSDKAQNNNSSIRETLEGL